MTHVPGVVAAGAGHMTDPTAGELREWTFVHALRARAMATPGEVLACFGDRPPLTLAETSDLVGRFAAAVRERGVQRGDRVLLALDNSPEFLVTWLGSWQAGAVVVPIVPQAGARVYARAMELTKPKMAFVDADAAERLVDPDGLDVTVLDDGVAAPLDPRLERWMVDTAEPVENLASGPDLAAIMLTSGTTGPSKGVCLSHLWYHWASSDVARGMSYRASDVLYTCLPLGHANAQDTTFGPALLSGARVCFDRRFSASRFWERIAATGATAFNLIGNMPRVLLNRSGDEYVPDHRADRAFAIPALKQHRHDFERRFGVRLLQGYGSTEIGVPFFEDRDVVDHDSCGRPAPGVAVRIMDADGLPCAANEPGEIAVWSARPGAITRGYYNDAGRTAHAWQGGWFHTGDRGWIDADGHLHFDGRLGDTIRRKGENISIHQLESVLLELDTISSCAVVGAPDEDGEPEIVAFVVAAERATLRADDVILHCARALGPAAAPSDVRLVDELPLTASGKVARGGLVELLGAVPASKAPKAGA